MTLELCAREGCGAPKAWHNPNATLPELREWEFRPDSHAYAFPFGYSGGGCSGSGCGCIGFLAPESPAAPAVKNKPFVIEFVDGLAQTPAVPLADYLAAHPQPPKCQCGGEPDDHDPVTGRCSHVVTYGARNGYFSQWGCQCPQYREVQP